MSTRNLLLAGCGFASVVMGLAAVPAYADSVDAEREAGEGNYGEIIVSARKRDENLQDVPIAINVLSAAAIDRKGIDGPDDVANQTPGLTFDVGLVPSDTRISIRGLQATRGRPNVAILIDGVDTSSENFGVAGGGILANLRLVDVERIEVIKGPQATLFGTASAVGAISLTSARPPLVRRYPSLAPLCRGCGATPASDAACLPEMLPSSGISASMVVATVGPTPLMPRKTASSAQSWGCCAIKARRRSSMAAICVCTARTRPRRHASAVAPCLAGAARRLRCACRLRTRSARNNTSSWTSCLTGSGSCHIARLR